MMRFLRLLLVGLALLFLQASAGQTRIDAAAAVRSVERHIAVSLSPSMTEEYPISNPVLIPNADAQQGPAVASDDSEYLVVWEDNRRGTLTDIYAARVDLNGNVLDPTGFMVSAAPHGEAQSPTVTWTGREFLVVWSDARNATTYDQSIGWTQRDIYAARVAPSGVVLDGAGVAIARGPARRISPAIAFDGLDALVVWQQRNQPTGSDLEAVRVATRGHLVVEGRPFVVSGTSGDQFSAHVAWGGGTTTRLGQTPRGAFLVAWQDDRSGDYGDIYAARVTAQGAVLEPDGIRIPTYYGSQIAPTVAWNPRQPGWLVAWTEDGSQTDAVFGARIAPSGAVLDQSGGFSIAEYEQPAVAIGVHVTTLGVYAVTYEHGGEVDEVYVSAGGVVAEATRRTLVSKVMSKGGGRAAIGSAGVHALVAWSPYDSTSTFDVLAVPSIDRAFAPAATGGPTVLSKAADPQSAPAVAWNGSEYLVAWFRRPSSIYAARVAASGTILDGVGFQVTGTSNPWDPISVSSNGHDFLVTWTDARLGFAQPRVYVARISAAGANLDPGGIGVSGLASYESASASDGNGYLIAWSSLQNAAAGGDVYGARVAADGTLIDVSGIALSTAPGNQLWPRLAWNGKEFLVVWQDGRSGVDVYGARVDKDGKVLDPSGIAIEAGPSNQQTPDVASDGQSFLVAWEQTASYDNFDVAATRVGEDGAILDKPATKIGAALHGRPAPALAWTGTDYVVGWRNPGGAAIAAAALEPDGTILGSAAASAPIGGGADVKPLAAAGGTGRAVLAYAYRADQPRYGSVSRVFLRFVK